MNLSYSEMLSLCEEVKRALVGARYLGMRQVQERKWIVAFDRGELLVCLKSPFIRFHLSNQRLKGPPAPFAAEIAGNLLDVSLLNEDKILALQFPTCFLIFELMPKSSPIHLVAHLADYHLPKRSFVHPTIPSPISSAQVEAVYALLEEKTALKKELKAQIKRNLQRYEQLKEENEKARTWEEEEHVAKLLQTFFFRLRKGLAEIEVEDWDQEGRLRKIPLDPLVDPAEQLKRRFKLSRKLKRRMEMGQELLQAQEERIQALQAQWDFLEQIKTIEELGPFKKTPPPKTAKAEPFRTFTSASGRKIYVGKNDRDNERLTFHVARGNDFWFHTANYPGSHVVLSLEKGETPDEESVLDAMQLALHYSKAPESDEIIIAQCKHLSKVRGGKPGLVHVSAHKRRLAHPDPIRLKKLLSKK